MKGCYELQVATQGKEEDANMSPGGNSVDMYVGVIGGVG